MFRKIIKVTLLFIFLSLLISINKSFAYKIITHKIVTGVSISKAQNYINFLNSLSLNKPFSYKENNICKRIL